MQFESSNFNGDVRGYRKYTHGSLSTVFMIGGERGVWRPFATCHNVCDRGTKYVLIFCLLLSMWGMYT